MPRKKRPIIYTVEQHYGQFNYNLTLRFVVFETDDGYTGYLELSHVGFADLTTKDVVVQGDHTLATQIQLFWLAYHAMKGFLSLTCGEHNGIYWWLISLLEKKMFDQA